MGTNKRYELKVWFKTPKKFEFRARKYTEPADILVELSSIREVDKWIDKDDKSIAKAVILDRVNGKVSEIELHSLTN